VIESAFEPLSMFLSSNRKNVPKFVDSQLSLSGQIFNFAINLIGSSGYAGVFALMLAEGATLPIPSEVVLPFAGYLVFQGKLNFWLVVIVATAGGLFGTFIDYSIGYYLGRAAVLRYGKYIRLNENHLKTSEKWFEKHGSITVLFTKFVPLVRTLIAFPAGIAEMKVTKFAIYSAVGILSWNITLVYVGVLAGQNSSTIISTLSNAFNLIEVLVGITIVLILVILLRRKQSPPNSPQSSLV
jgi:membrane protein DedA with SNARE-associated domain